MKEVILLYCWEDYFKFLIAVYSPDKDDIEIRLNPETSLAGMTRSWKKFQELPEHIQIYEPEMVYRHPKYNDTHFDFDVALVCDLQSLPENCP